MYLQRGALVNACQHENEGQRPGAALNQSKGSAKTRKGIPVGALRGAPKDCARHQNALSSSLMNNSPHTISPCFSSESIEIRAHHAVALGLRVNNSTFDAGTRLGASLRMRTRQQDSKTPRPNMKSSRAMNKKSSK